MGMNSTSGAGFRNPFWGTGPARVGMDTRAREGREPTPNEAAAAVREELAKPPAEKQDLSE